MIKILHIHTLPVISGSGINTFLSMNLMDRSIFKPELACAPGGKLIDLVREHGMEVNLFRDLVQPIHPLKDCLALIKLTSFLKKRKYTIVHTHNSKAGFIGRLAAKLAGVPIIIHTVHGFSFHDQEPLCRQILFKNLERMAHHWCDRMIFISQPLIDWALREQIAPKNKMTKIYSGIDLDKFKPLSEIKKTQIKKNWGIAQDEVVIGIVSKLWEGKGHGILIKAFKKIREELKNVKLVIVGEGYLQKDLQNLTNSFGLKNHVIFTGFQMDVSEISAIFDVAVLPSFFEGMGRVLLEAMAQGKPVVASNVGGIPDLVKDGVNGLLITPGNVQELAYTVTKLLMNKSLASKLAKEGKKMTTERFSAKVMGDDITKLYMKCLKMKGITGDS